jgi:hypothetical protein
MDRYPRSVKVAMFGTAGTKVLHGATIFRTLERYSYFFFVSLAVHLSIILAIDQLNAQILVL